MSERSQNSIEYNRNFSLILYPDNEVHCSILEKIKSMYDMYAYCLHDKDTYEFSDEVKKPHYHVILKFKNQRYRTALSSELGLEKNLIEGCSLDNMLLYLIHFNDEDKYQYSIDIVKGTLLPRLKKIMNSDGKDEGERVIDLMDYIDSTTTALRVSDFARYCASNGYWDVYRRSASIFREYIREHNCSYFIQSKKQGWEHITDDDLLEYVAKCN